MSASLFDWFSSPSGLTPHGFCLFWEPWLIWTHALSDTAIAVAYYTIPLALALVARRRRDLVFRPVFWLFAAFILLCGTGHWLDLLTLWVPAYATQAVVKAATALASVVTAVALWKLLPAALALPSQTQLRQAMDALRDSEARHRISFEQSPVPIHTMDAAGRIVGASRSWLALFGYAPEEVLGRRLADFVAPGSDGLTEQDMARLMAEGDVRDLERRFLRKDGGIVDAQVSARIDHKGHSLLIVCVVIDITARRRAEDALRASEDRLRQSQKMEAVGQLTGGIAHDFNNMLQGIGGSLELMTLRLEDGQPQALPRLIASARNSVDRAAGLTHRMLAFARRQALRPTQVDPEALVGSMAELIRRTVGPSIDLRLRLESGGWQVRCDANQLESAMLNLSINARDAMPDGGTLTICTSPATLTLADLPDPEDAAPGEFVVITVCDTGLGMTPDVLSRAFEPFFTTKPIGQGTGLGLSQLYGFIRQSGGVVRLDSEPGRGVSAKLYLPRAAEIETAEPEEPQHPAPRLLPEPVGGTVLIVEDDPSVRDLLIQTVEQLGCRVLHAMDGPGGLRIVQSRDRLDMLVTDVGLPGLNGRQLADAAQERWPGLPVLLITGYAGVAWDDLSLPRGMQLMTKPFPHSELAVRIAKALRRRGDPREAMLVGGDGFEPPALSV